VDLHILFIDFKKAYDSIKHSAIWRALEDLGCPPKLIRMIQLTLKGANAKVRCGRSTRRDSRLELGCVREMGCRCCSSTLCWSGSSGN
jgi:hypothetical protein